jgi:hypothetical protein
MISTAQSTLHPTPVVLEAVVDRLRSLRLGDAAPGQPAFHKVALYDHPNLTAALDELLTFSDRLCLVIYQGEQFEPVRQGRHLHLRQTLDLQLLIADYHPGNRQLAHFGIPAVAPFTPATSPTFASGGTTGAGGVVGLKDLLLSRSPAVDPAQASPGAPPISVANFFGLLLPNLYLQPVESRPFPLTGAERERLAGRATWEIHCQARGGQLTTDLGPHPIV